MSRVCRASNERSQQGPCHTHTSTVQALPHPDHPCIPYLNMVIFLTKMPVAGVLMSRMASPMKVAHLHATPHSRRSAAVLSYLT
jgi:hypothetical protein